LATPAKIEYYSVLGVDRSATQDEIKAAFDRLANTFKAAGKPRNIEDVEEIRTIATAYRVLSAPEKRSRYDKSGLTFIDDPENRLARSKDKLDELFEWLEERSNQDGGGIDISW